MGFERIGPDDMSHAGLTLPPESRYVRRLSDKVLIAFHFACDLGDLKVAEDLLGVLEFMEKRPRLQPGRERRSEESLVAAHERLWFLRHPDLL
jgi:hypothetical protein